jgi:hypothetical protein
VVDRCIVEVDLRASDVYGDGLFQDLINTDS